MRAAACYSPRKVCAIATAGNFGAVPGCSTQRPCTALAYTASNQRPALGMLLCASKLERICAFQYSKMERQRPLVLIFFANTRTRPTRQLTARQEDLTRSNQKGKAGEKCPARAVCRVASSLFIALKLPRGIVKQQQVAVVALEVDKCCKPFFGVCARARDFRANSFKAKMGQFLLG